jgi:uncharacterized membrane protein YfcA
MTRPNLSYLKSLILAVVGIPCGVFTGLTGLSCAPILQPLLRWLLGISGSSLSGTVLVAVSFISWCGLVSYGQNGDVQWGSGLLITLGILIGATLAGKAIKSSPLFFVKMSKVWSFIPLLFSLIMIAQSTNIIARTTLGTSWLPNTGPVLPIIWCVLIGVIVGFIGLAGDLGSMLVIPLLLYATGKTIYQAEGTALFALLMVSLPTATLHLLRRSFNPSTALALSVGGVFGALFGSRIAVNAPATLTLIFVCGAAILIFSLMNLFQTVPTAKPTDSSNTDSQ